MAYIIHGATGAQGAPLYNLLLKSGKSVLGAVRDVSNLKGQPAIKVDLGSVNSLVAAYRDADGVFIHIPLGAEAGRVQYARNIVEAIRQGRPKRVVITTSGAVIDQPDTPLQTPEDSAIAILIRGVEESGVSHAIMATRLYLENLLLPPVFKPIKLEDALRYPLAGNFAASWCSHLDVADVAARLLTDTAISGIVGVGQLPGLTGPQLADGFASALGHDVSYETIKPQEFGALISPILGAAAASGVVKFYDTLAKVPEDVIAEKTSAQRLLNIQPRTVAAWLAEKFGGSKASPSAAEVHPLVHL
ncbi:hydroxylase [Brucella endophytica]|uniref:Hydroxylase n=1 Tax=Brucella endophytica TaxID=1963359 RepID=A0A916SF80_9HYPH|nr:NAD(P)H-binding protein [Brucella endophytica]GGA97125.1 hydroxylase [Brucella endophytica]